MEKPNIEILDTGIDLNNNIFIVDNKSFMSNLEAFRRCYLLLEEIEKSDLKIKKGLGMEFEDSTYIEILQKENYKVLVIKDRR